MARSFILALLLSSASGVRLPFLRRRGSGSKSLNERATAEAATPAGAKKLAQIRTILADAPFVSSVTRTLASDDDAAAATAAERAAIAAARAALPDDAWVASRTDDELLPFARAAGSDDLVERLAETSAWRAQNLPDAADRSWELSRFFAANEGSFAESDELGARPFLEWVRDGDGDGDDSAPAVTLDGASLIVLRPGRHRVGAIEAERWLKLISWQGERATTTWARAAGSEGGGADGRGAVSLIVDRTGAGLRNQDPALLRRLLPALTRHYPYSLHRAYVAPVNVVFWAIWSVAKALLPAKVTARFTLLSGDDWREKLAEEIGEPEVAERLRAYIDT